MMLLFSTDVLLIVFISCRRKNPTKICFMWWLSVICVIYAEERESHNLNLVDPCTFETQKYMRKIAQIHINLCDSLYFMQFTM